MKHPPIIFAAALLLFTSFSLLLIYRERRVAIQSIPKVEIVQKESNTRIVKVLNRVACTEDKKWCSQDEKDDLWNLCINRGYEQLAPSREIVQARTIKEMYSDTIEKEETHSRQIHYTDENGVVVQGDPKDYQVSILRKIEGYCIGSEYIVK